MKPPSEKPDPVPAVPAPRPRRPRTGKLDRLVGRLVTLNRLHAALRSTLDLEHLHSIILASLISRSGLSYSRAAVAVFDEASQSFRGRAALGARSRAEDERFHQEADAEEEALAGVVRDLEGMDSSGEEKALLRRSMQDLSQHSFWITLSEKFSLPELNQVIRGVELFIESGDEPGEGRRFLADLQEAPGARLYRRAELAASDLPPNLLELLPGDTVWSIVRTNRGPRLLVVADRAFQRAPLGELDLLQMDWFCGQVALALENAEMFRDLDETYQSMRALDQLKSNFLATISHELRTPLTAIGGYAQLLLGGKIGKLTPAQREIMERILAHGDLLTGKVNDILEIAELESSRTRSPQIQPVDPLSVLMNTMPRLEKRRAHKDIAIEPVVSPPIPEILTTPISLERILFHLLDNAIKFGRQGGRVRISFERERTDLRIAIADDGIGIAPAQLEPIFEAFYQGDSRLTRHYEGLGIGLAIVKKQLDLTGGRIQVVSEVGRGTTFTIIYPVA